MKCIGCQTEMMGLNDMQIDYFLRIDFVKCPKCQSTAYLFFNTADKYVEKVEWKR